MPDRSSPLATEQPAPDLSVIIVSWNVRDLLRECLRSVPGCQSSVASSGSGVVDRPSAACTSADHRPLSATHHPLSVEIIVVDNASSDGSAAMVAAEFPSVRLIANTENRGFTGGNNQGIALARGRYLFFLNPDTEIVGDALATMAAYLDAHPDVGAVGPRLRYGDGSPQSSRRRFPTLLTALFESTPLAWHWPDNPWARWYRMEERTSGAKRQTSAVEDEDAAGGEEVDWLVGAALMTRRAVIEQVGGFDEGYFMYSEELDWCRRVKAAGWRIVFLPAAEIIHYEGKSSEQAVAARHIRFQASKVRYFHKFHGAAAAELLRVFILAAFAVEWCFEAAKWLLGSKRRLRRDRMAAYQQLLASGLRTGRRGDW